MGTSIVFVAFMCSIASTTAMETVYMQSRGNASIDILKSTTLRVEATEWSYYRSNSYCMLTITTQSSYGMMISFQDLSMESSSNCEYDRLVLYDGASKSQNKIGLFCGSYTPSTVYTTSGNTLTLLFQSDKNVRGSGFDVVITPYHTGNCTSSDMTCSNGICVDESFRCNGYNPCGDDSDCAESRTTTYVVAAERHLDRASVFVFVAAIVISNERVDRRSQTSP